MNFIAYLILAQPAAEPTGDIVAWALGLVKWVAEQFAAKNYVAAVAAIVMGLVFLAKLLLKDKLSAGTLPLLSAGLGLLAALATSLLVVGPDAGAASVASIILTGVTTGAMASGFWSLLGKHLVDWVKSLLDKAQKKETPEPEAKPEDKPQE